MPFYVVDLDNCGRWAGLSSDSGRWQWNHTLFNSDTGEIGTLDNYEEAGYHNSLTRKTISESEFREMLEVPDSVRAQYMEILAAKKAAMVAEREAARKAEQEAAKLKFANMIAEDARTLMLSNEEALLKMHDAHGNDVYVECVKMCKSYLNGRLKNSFRKSIAEQIMDWCHDPERQKKYSFPLSKNQTRALTNGMRERNNGYYR